MALITTGPRRESQLGHSVGFAKFPDRTVLGGNQELEIFIGGHYKIGWDSGCNAG